MLWLAVVWYVPCAPWIFTQSDHVCRFIYFANAKIHFRWLQLNIFTDILKTYKMLSTISFIPQSIYFLLPKCIKLIHKLFSHWLLSFEKTLVVFYVLLSGCWNTIPHFEDMISHWQLLSSLSQTAFKPQAHSHCGRLTYYMSWHGNYIMTVTRGAQDTMLS